MTNHCILYLCSEAFEVYLLGRCMVTHLASYWWISVIEQLYDKAISAVQMNGRML